MKKTLFAALATIILVTGLAAPVRAATTAPDASANPVFANIQKAGAKFYYLGNRNGLDGWFIVKDGQVQIGYATPDNKGALIGALFGQDGENITVLQISNLMQNNKEISDLVASVQKEQVAISQVGSPPAPGSVGANTGLPSTPLSPGERLIHDLGAASGVIVGQANTPEILMVMDPRCPHCQATWKALRDPVMKGNLHIRLIPIGAQDSDNERAAGVLLTATDPLNAWDKFVGGDKAPLAGAASPAALAAVRANHTVIDSWHIESTPYLVYRAKDGKVKIVQGEVEKPAVLFSDLGM